MNQVNHIKFKAMGKNGWLTTAAAVIIVTIIAGIIYVSVQQTYRSNADDPQLSIVRQLSQRLKGGQPVSELVKSGNEDLANSLNAFTAVYNQQGEPLQSTALLDGKLPAIPKGALDFAKRNGEHTVTWQPKPGIRMATVIESVQSPSAAFVVSGRSLEEVEKRVSNLTSMILAGWLACMGIIIIHYFTMRLLNRKMAV